MMDNKRKNLERRKAKFISDKLETTRAKKPNKFQRRKEEVERYRQEILLKAELERDGSSLVDVDERGEKLRQLLLNQLKQGRNVRQCIYSLDANGWLQDGSLCDISLKSVDLSYLILRQANLSELI